MHKLKIWIDADSAPVLMRRSAAEISSRNKCAVVFVANREIPTENAAEMVVCGAGKDEADNYIIRNASKNDIAITRDILFAERLVEKGITAMNDRGTVFTKDNIQDRLIERSMSMNLAEIGLGSKKKSTYGEKELKKFAATFEAELLRHIAAETYGYTL